MCCPLWFRTPLSSDIKIARLGFLFVRRLRTGIDLRDQTDLAPARSVTIGNWFSDCIGTSSLVRRSQIVRVVSHQIEAISTHRKIGHSPSIMWALVVSFSPNWTKLLVSQDSVLFWLGPQSFPSSRVGSLGFLESCSLHCLTFTGLQGLVMRCLMNLSRESCFQR
jgi:hypothetical protein